MDAVVQGKGPTEYIPDYQNQKHEDLPNKIWTTNTISSRSAKNFTFSSASRRCVAVHASPGRVGDFSHLNGHHFIEVAGHLDCQNN